MQDNNSVVTLQSDALHSARPAHFMRFAMPNKIESVSHQKEVQVQAPQNNKSNVGRSPCEILVVIF
jgi:hypothetical protein